MGMLEEKRENCCKFWGLLRSLKALRNVRLQMRDCVKKAGLSMQHHCKLGIFPYLGNTKF